MFGILADKSRPIGETLALALLYGYQAQGELDGEFDPLEQSGVFVPELRKYAGDVYYEFVPGMAHCSMTQEIASRYFDFIVKTIERNS